MRMLARPESQNLDWGTYVCLENYCKTVAVAQSIGMFLPLLPGCQRLLALALWDPQQTSVLWIFIALDVREVRARQRTGTLQRQNSPRSEIRETTRAGKTPT